MSTLTENDLSAGLIRALKELEKKTESHLLIQAGDEKFVVMKEHDYRGWLETAYLLSSKKNAKVLQEAIDESLDKCKDLDDVLKDLDR